MCIKFTQLNTNSNISFLDIPIGYLKGIGPQRAETLQKELGIFTYKDLLTHYPFRYVDRTQFQSVKDVTEDSAYYQLRGTLESLEVIGEKRTKRLVARFKDNSGILELVWFQGYKWMAEKLRLHTEYIVYGRASSFKGRFNMAHPDIELVTPEMLAAQSAFQAVYHSGEKLKFKGLDSEGIRKAMRVLVSHLNEQNIPETLTYTVIDDFKLLSKLESLKQIHFPDSKVLLDKARFRLKFEELFFVQLKLLRSNLVRHQVVQGFVFGKVGDVFNNFYNHHLPFQ